MQPAHVVATATTVLPDEAVDIQAHVNFKDAVGRGTINSSAGQSHLRTLATSLARRHLEVLVHLVDGCIPTTPPFRVNSKVFAPPVISYCTGCQYQQHAKQAQC